MSGTPGRRLASRSRLIVRAAAPPERKPRRSTQPDEIAQRLRDGRLRTIVGQVRPLEEASAAFNSTARVMGKTIIQLADPQGR